MKRTLTACLMIFALLLATSSADAKKRKRSKSRAPDKPMLTLKKLDSTASITSTFAAGKVTALGREFDALTYCNEGTLENTSALEAYAIETKTYQLAVLCPGQMDGETNVITVFGEKAEPKSRRVTPLPSSSRIDDRTLLRNVEELVGH